MMIFLLKVQWEHGRIFGLNLSQPPHPDDYLDEDVALFNEEDELKIIHVPGHSPGSLVFYSPKQNFLIAGDVLFAGSIGRTDLPGGDYDTLINGIKVSYCVYLPIVLFTQAMALQQP
jgi:hydroxyacylglutathione hydrolase